MFSSRGKDSKNLDIDGPGENASNEPSMLPQRYTPDRPKRVWKAYHERQALLQVDRQCSRPVFVDSLVWGDLSAEKLTALIEKERDRSKRFVVGRAGERCCLTDRDARSHYAGGAEEADASKRPKMEFTADFFGAKGDFHQVNNRRYYGFETRSAEAGGPAAQRAKAKAISKEGKADKADLKDYEKPVAKVKGAPLWQGGVFAGEAASALSASGVNNGGGFSGGGKQGRLETHPLPPCIGPGTHRLVFEEVERVRERTMTGEYDFSNASVAHKLRDSLVVMKELNGEKEGTKLRGTAVMERRGMDNVRTKEGFAERVSRRLKDASRGGKIIYSGSCSVVAFEDLYVKATQMAQALPTVERTMQSKEERRLKARASEEFEIKSSSESSVGTDPRSNVLVDRLRSSSGDMAASDGDSLACTIGKTEGNAPSSSQTATVMAWPRQGWWRTSRQKSFSSSTAVVTPGRSEERSEDRSGQAGSSFGASPVTAFARVRRWQKGWRQRWRKNIVSGRTRGIDGEGSGLESVTDLGTESSTKANALTDLGLILASERGGWRRRGDGGKSMEKYSISHWHKIALFSSKQSQSMELEERTALLIEACEWGDVKALQRLLQLGASPLDPYSPGVNGSRCVLCQFFMFLLQVGAGMRPRLAPDDALHEQVLEVLMRSRLDSNSKFLSSGALRDDDDRGFSLLHHAAAFGNVCKAEFLLQRGIDPDIRAKGGGETALMVATLIGRRDHIRVADTLLRAGADLSAEDNKGMTALHQAAFSGSQHMCHYLLLVGADRDARDHSGKTPVELCRRDAHPRTYALLQEFAPCQPPPPRVILDYMEKVEVYGVEVGTALDQMRHKKTEMAIPLNVVVGGESSGSMGS